MVVILLRCFEYVALCLFDVNNVLVLVYFCIATEYIASFCTVTLSAALHISVFVYKCFNNFDTDHSTFFLEITKVTRKPCYRKDDRAMRPIYGCPENFRDSLTTPTATIPTFSWAFVPIDPMNVPTKFEVRSFTRS